MPRARPPASALVSSASPTSCRGSAGAGVPAAMRSIEHLLCSELPNASKEGTVCRTARNPWADVASARRGRLGAGPAWMWPVSAGANAGPFMPGADVGEAPGCSQKYLAPSLYSAGHAGRRCRDGAQYRRRRTWGQPRIGQRQRAAAREAYSRQRAGGRCRGRRLPTAPGLALVCDVLRDVCAG
jgi:hypothetical protein